MLNRRVIEFVTARDPDAVLMEHLSAARLRPAGVAPAMRREGEPMRLLLAGYFGAGNTGSEMRASEIVRHVRRLLGEGNVTFTALSLTDRLPEDLFPQVSLRMLSGFYPEIVAEEVTASHGVLACEGSTFKSTFSDVLTALMAGPLGAAARAGQPAIAYGAEVGELTPSLADYVRENAAGSLILARNKPSADRAANLGLRAVCGADTAWTFTPSSRERARTLLTDAGWNGEDPIVVFCPMNPFWWPVRAEPATYAAMQRSGEGKARHYGAVFFHRDSSEIRARYVRFIQALASAFERIIAERGSFPVIVGMDQVDGAACDDLAAALPSGAAVFRSREFSVRDIVALLREAQLLVSGRFHALVGAMPAAVPSIGLAFDDRIRNLLSHAPRERVLAANAPDLSERIVIAAKGLEQDRVRAEARAAVAAGLEGMARMADAFRCEISRLVPDLSLPDLPDGLVGRLPVAVEQLLA